VEACDAAAKLVRWIKKSCIRVGHLLRECQKGSGYGVSVCVDCAKLRHSGASPDCPVA
jgi:hypothetical protein